MHCLLITSRDRVVSSQAKHCSQRLTMSNSSSSETHVPTPQSEFQDYLSLFTPQILTLLSMFVAILGVGSTLVQQGMRSLC